MNRLTTWGLPADTARRIPVPRWWITDHFGDASIPNPLEPGCVVRSVHAGFPHASRKVALPASDWGHYGRRGPIPGATLFELL